MFFILQPDNLAVLSEGAVHTKIRNLTAILKSLDGLEMACINSRENFDSNKHFYKQRISEEKSLKVREILEQELTYLDRVQVQMASAREFLLVARAKNSQEEVLAVIGRVEKLLKDNGFNGRLARKEDLKRILSVYFIQNITQVYFDDIDGERYVKEGVSHPHII